jgi:putative CocE/NonD family hydrolase
MLTGLREGLAWFDAHLRRNDTLRSHPVRIHVLGADEWREFDEFPPPIVPTRFFLHREGTLSRQAPQADQPCDRYTYDPADPTPALGGAFLGFKGAGAQNNGPLEVRSDVLCYTSPPLAEPLEIIGFVHLELYAQSSLPYADFFGRLCVVDRGGTSTNICDGLFRVTPENSDRQTDGALRLHIDMWATGFRFRTGQRIRLQVSSGAHPRWSRNLGTEEPLALGTRLAIAEQTIYHDVNHPSALVLPVVVQ